MTDSMHAKIHERFMKCYEDFADEVIVVGKDWPYEFSWDYIQTVFKKVLINQRETGLFGWILHNVS